MYDSSAEWVAYKELARDRVTSLSSTESTGNKQWLLKTILSKLINYTLRVLYIWKWQRFLPDEFLNHWVKTYTSFDHCFHGNAENI